VIQDFQKPNVNPRYLNQHAPLVFTLLETLPLGYVLVQQFKSLNSWVSLLSRAKRLY